MIIEIAMQLPEDALEDLVQDILDRYKDTLSLLAEHGMIEDYEMEVKSL